MLNATRVLGDKTLAVLLAPLQCFCVHAWPPHREPSKLSKEASLPNSRMLVQGKLPLWWCLTMVLLRSSVGYCCSVGGLVGVSCTLPRLHATSVVGSFLLFADAVFHHMERVCLLSLWNGSGAVWFWGCCVVSGHSCSDERSKAIVHGLAPIVASRILFGA